MTQSSNGWWTEILCQTLKKKKKEKKEWKYWIDWNDVFVFQRQIVNQFRYCQIFDFSENAILFILQLSYFPRLECSKNYLLPRKLKTLLIFQL